MKDVKLYVSLFFTQGFQVVDGVLFGDGNHLGSFLEVCWGRCGVSDGWDVVGCHGWMV